MACADLLATKASLHQVTVPLARAEDLNLLLLYLPIAFRQFTVKCHFFSYTLKSCQTWICLLNSINLQCVMIIVTLTTEES